MNRDAPKSRTALPAGAIVLGGSYGALAVARSLGRQGLGVAYLTRTDTVAQYSKYVRHHIPWNGPGAPNALQQLLAVADELQLEGWVLLPASDHDVQFVTQNYDVLSQRFALATMPWSELEQLNDKGQLYQLAEQLGMGFPEVFWDGKTQRAQPDEVRLPAVIKPASTEKVNPLTKAKAWKAETSGDYRQKFELATQYMDPAEVVVQELIPGDGGTQYSYAGLWDHGHELCGLTARRARQYPAEFGTSPFVEAVALPEVQRESRKLLEAVRYHGLVEVEFKHDRRDDRLKLLDVNTRVWAWIGLGAAAGLDFPMLAVALASGVFPGAIEPIYGASWVHPIPNAASLLTSLMSSGRLGYAGRRSLQSGSVSSIYAADDWWPALVELPVQFSRRLKGLFRRG